MFVGRKSGVLAVGRACLFAFSSPFVLSILMGSDDSMTTETSSKLSRSRRESDRGPKRVKRQLERARKHKLARGESWVPPDILRRQAAEAATGLHGSVAEEVQGEKMHEKKAEPLPDQEEKRKLIEDALMD